MCIRVGLVSTYSYDNMFLLTVSMYITWDICICSDMVGIIINTELFLTGFTHIMGVTFW